jgi:hypothetical protein
MKTQLTLENVQAIEEACTRYMEKAGENVPSDLLNCMLVNANEGPQPWENATQLCLEINDFDYNHDFSTLRGILQDAGLDPHALDMEEFEGTAECEFGDCALYGWNIELAKRPWEKLVINNGIEAACDILNELTAERMQQEHPEHEELDPQDKHILWEQYSQKFTGDAADELLSENGYK